MTLIQALDIFSISEDNISIITREELKELYHKLAKQKHPDKVGGDSSEFIALKDAYILISAHIRENTGRELVKLDKEEILQRYQEDTKRIYGKMIDQFHSINKIRDEVESLIKDFEQKKKNLEQDLNKSITDLEESYKKNVFQKMFFFFPHMSEKEFWEKYNNLMKEQSNKYKELDFDLFKKMTGIYGKGLNEISDTLDTLI